MTATMPDRMDLPTRLQAARAEAGPLRNRVAELEAELNEALENSDYDRASQLQAELLPARQELVIATGTLEGLQRAMQEIEAARQAEQRKIEQQRRREETQRQVEELQAREGENLDEMHRLIATARAGVEAVRGNLEEALRRQNAAGGARREAQALLAGLEGQQPGYVSMPNDATVLIERDQVIRAVYRGRV